MILCEFSIFPLDKGESVGAYVARCLDLVDKSGIPYRTNPMGTVIEGEWDQVMGVIRDCYENLKADCARVELMVKFDYRAGDESRLDRKIASIEKRLGRMLKK